MQPIKITLKGDFFDCQIYRGRLYLWTFNGSLKVYNWNDLVHSFIKKETDKIAMTFCFLDGNYLYKPSLMELFKDTDFKNLLLKKFDDITNIDFYLSEIDLQKFLFGEQETPTGIIPTDTEIYSNKLYFIHEKGLFQGSAHRNINDKYPVSSKPVKLWDCNLLSIKANKYPQLALSGGNEGLFELNLAESIPTNLSRVEEKQPIFKISSNHSSFSNYSFLSIYNTSLVDNSFLALFKWNTIKDKKDNDVYRRDFEKKIIDDAIFQSTNKKHFISWGIEDKIYKATENGFDIMRFNNYANIDNGEEKFTKLKSVDLHPWKGMVINGGSSYFGNIVECENALVVLQSDGEYFTIVGPITRWRVYPRSLNYENHLHVILEDRIEIYSFYQDYFLDQVEKEIGIQFKTEKRRRTYRKSYFDESEENSYNFSEDMPF